MKKRIGKLGVAGCGISWECFPMPAKRSQPLNCGYTYHQSSSLPTSFLDRFWDRLRDLGPDAWRDGRRSGSATKRQARRGGRRGRSARRQARLQHAPSVTTTQPKQPGGALGCEGGALEVGRRVMVLVVAEPPEVRTSQLARSELGKVSRPSLGIFSSRRTRHVHPRLTA